MFSAIYGKSLDELFWLLAKSCHLDQLTTCSVYVRPTSNHFYRDKNMKIFWGMLVFCQMNRIVHQIREGCSRNFLFLNREAKVCKPSILPHVWNIMEDFLQIFTRFFKDQHFWGEKAAHASHFCNNFLLSLKDYTPKRCSPMTCNPALHFEMPSSHRGYHKI